MSQLLQPANVTPLKPQLGQQNSFLAQRAGPSPASFDEFASPVVANGLKLRASGGRRAATAREGHDVSLARAHATACRTAPATTGSRPTVFATTTTSSKRSRTPSCNFGRSHDTNLQGRAAVGAHGARRSDGILSTATSTPPLSRFDEDADSLRLGAQAPANAESHAARLRDLPGRARRRAAGDAFALPNRSAGLQRRRPAHLSAPARLSIQSGFLAARRTTTSMGSHSLLASGRSLISGERTNRQLGLYTYAYFNVTPTLAVTAGVSLDSIDNPLTDEEATRTPSSASPGDRRRTRPCAQRRSRPCSVA